MFFFSLMMQSSAKDVVLCSRIHRLPFKSTAQKSECEGDSSQSRLSTGSCDHRTHISISCCEQLIHSVHTMMKKAPINDYKYIILICRSFSSSFPFELFNQMSLFCKSKVGILVYVHRSFIDNFRSLNLTWFLDNISYVTMIYILVHVVVKWIH